MLKMMSKMWCIPRKFVRNKTRCLNPEYNDKFKILLEINKNLKFKKGVGITIKSKETSSKLAI